MATYIPIGGPANDAEIEGIRLLRDLLPDHYVIIGNFDLRLEGRRNSLEMDAVVIAEHGLFVVEIKGWSGPIHGDARRWKVPWGTVSNPITPLERKAKALRQYLGAKCGGLPAEVFCSPVVLFPRKVEELSLPVELRRHVIQPDEVYAYFVDLELLQEQGPGRFRDKAARDAIVNAIAPVADAPGEKITIETYEIERELQVPHRQYREYVGQHRYLQSRSRVRIKAYSMDPLHDRARQQAEITRVMRDTEALSVLDDNPYVARSYDVLRDRDDELIFYMVSEWVGAKTLGDYLERARQEGWRLERRWELARELTAAVQSIHQAGILHRNLHPGVIYMTRREARVPFKIADFDYSRVQQLESISEDLNAIGTEGYRAPELWLGQPYDHRVDVFSLGAILFELLTLERLFEGMSDLLQIEETWARRKAAIPWEAVAEVIGQMLGSEPGERLGELDLVSQAFEATVPAPG
ncbi:hypothetical protein DL240_09360 [Lujinxingia litoralis]|uniref:non-specific serine/threonine protein kinase n=1 Tax=Lujinxingia litoralis TaxID=2211119 RepID=A0A328CBD2_9DELT|nr:NERD domain-containing protein kinase family protein [Lujinxingia litoralis]RAL23083.1 hypothetical protein DL240_09360 [Lujinxingia litoralis]